MHRLLAVLAFSMLGISAAVPQTMQLTVDGRQRSYLLARPAVGGPSPTLIMLHGAGGTSEREAQRTGLLQLAPRVGLAAAFGQSASIVWNRSLPGKESAQIIDLFRATGGVPNDFGYLRALVADLVRRGVADPKRIYLAGASNGGFMTLAMFCSSDGTLFAGIGLVVTAMTEQMGDECRPPRPMPVVMLFGTADTVVPYRGGPLAPLAYKGGVLQGTPAWSADRLVLFFRRLNGCDGQPERSVIPGQNQVDVERWTKCAGGPVLVHRVVGGTHVSAAQVVHPGQMMLDFFRDGPGGKVAAAKPPITAPESKAPRPPATEPKVAAIKPGAFNFIAYRRTDGNRLVTGALRRTSGNEWIEVDTQGAKWTFRSTAETDAEIVLYDANRAIHLRADITLKRLFIRRGNSAWELHSEIVRADR